MIIGAHHAVVLNLTASADTAEQEASVLNAGGLDSNPAFMFASACICAASDRLRFGLRYCSHLPLESSHRKSVPSAASHGQSTAHIVRSATIGLLRDTTGDRRGHASPLTYVF